MIIRCAFFEGKIHDGKEEEFDAFVREKLVPLWIRFPGAQSVNVLRETDAEDGSHRYPMILQISYLSQEAMETALMSSVRLTSREVTKTLLQMFDGRVFHVVYDANQYRPAL